MTAKHSIPRAAPLVLVALIALADALFWDVAAGLSLPVFALCVTAAAAILKGVSRRDGAIAIGIVLVSCIPVFEQVQFLSRLFYWAGFLGVAGWIALGGSAAPKAILRAAARFTWLAPWLLTTDIQDGLTQASDRKEWLRWGARAVLGWAVPLGLGAVFLVLFAAANPIAEEILNLIDLEWLFQWISPQRISFWVLMVALVWPFLRLTRMAPRIALPFWRPKARATLVRPRAKLLNPASIGNSLALFNALFALQSAMDIGFLWGGIALPEGMSYAQYAHRGAYPLVATALLAGAFALISARFATKGWMRVGLVLFLVQNLMLVASSALRLDLYVDAYGLTYLRVSAAIWMGLVAVGLLTTLWQITAAKSNFWLLGVNACLLVVVLYGASLTNWAGVIARHNLDPGFAGEIDSYYLCGLGEGAYPVILEWEKRTGRRIYPSDSYAKRPEFRDWREWGFRLARVQRYFDRAQQSARLEEVAP